MHSEVDAMGVFRKVGRATKWVAKPMVDVPSWVGFKQIKVLTLGVVEQLNWLFHPKPKEDETPTETFEEAVAHQNLTPELLEQRRKNFLQLAVFFFFIGIGILFYGIYLFWQGGLMSGFLAVILSSVSFASGIRYHFWAFQIKHRKLGCTLKEWWNSKITESNDES